METITVNSAAGSVIADPYDPNNLILYHTALSLAESLVHEGILSAADYRKARTILTKRHGLPLDSIFAESA